MSEANKRFIMGLFDMETGLKAVDVQRVKGNVYDITTDDGRVVRFRG